MDNKLAIILSNIANLREENQRQNRTSTSSLVNKQIISQINPQKYGIQP
jgi:hypothetical protein